MSYMSAYCNEESETSYVVVASAERNKLYAYHNDGAMSYIRNETQAYRVKVHYTILCYMTIDGKKHAAARHPDTGQMRHCEQQ